MISNLSQKFGRPTKGLYYVSISIIYLVFFLNFSNVSSQLYLVNFLTPLKYYSATEEPDSNWYMPDYDDSLWSQDTGSIGYGNFNQNVTIDEGTVSLYLRYRFNISDKSEVEKINLSCNFDDGYIAYLNGKEVLRINVVDSVKTPAFNDIAIRSHEMEIYPWPVLGYYFESPGMDSFLVDSTNVLALHVLNDTIGGSDLYCQANIYNITGMQYNMYSSAFRYKRQYMLDSTDFPLIIIDTDEHGIPYKNIRKKAFMGIIDNGPGNYNLPADSFNVYSGEISIEVRGESSSEFPKRSYRFETIYTVDTVEIDTNVALLGMPADDDWILFGPFHDKAQFRNKMINDLGRRLGSYQTRSRFCELIMNGEYLGLYRLSETIKRNANRVNIARLREEEITGIDVTGGYIMRLDKDVTNNVEIVYPKSDRIQPGQTEYIFSFLDTFMNVLYSNDFSDPDIGYRKYMSDTSLVDNLVINELTKNADAYLYSTYFYKDRADRDNRIKFGPLWDYDLAFGNSRFQQADLTEGWQFDVNTRVPVTRILQDVEFVEFFQDRWHELRLGMLHNDSLFALIDSMGNYIQEPRERNYEVWPVISEYLFFPNYISQTYEEEIQNIKDWLTDRVQWIDDNIDNIYYPVNIYTEFEDSKIPEYFGFEAYPNPFTDQLSIAITSSYSGDIEIKLLNLLGQSQLELSENISKGYNEIIIDKANNLPSGVYIMYITLDSEIAGIKKLVKR
ncbi:MAG: CotH kinase family protein [Bacteroidales bacterium]|nr:MAG: CotH kinase family protein [Bacteroidales bacterium]